MRMLEYFIIIYALMIIIWAIFLYFKKRNLKEAKVFSFFIFFSALWIISVSITNLSSVVDNVIFLTRVCYLFSILAVLSFLYFSLVFKEYKERTTIKKFFYLIIIAISSIFIFLNFYLPNDKIYSEVQIFSDKMPQGKIGSIYLLFSVFLFFLLIYSSIILLRGYKKQNYRRKSQLKYVVSGFILFSVCAITFDIIFPLFGEERFYNFGQISSIFFIGFTSYAIVKHQLLDIRIVIQRGVIYSVSLSIIVGFYIALVLVLGLVLQQASEITALLAAGITTILGIYGVPLIEKYFRRWSDKIFFKDKYDYSKAVFEISEVLNENINLRALIVKIAQKLDKILKVKFVEVIIPGYNLKYDRNRVFKPLGEIFPVDYLKIIQEQKLTVFNYSDILYLLEQAERKNDVKTINQLKALEHYGKKYNIALSVAIVIEDKLFGIITLGEKRSGDIFNSDDNDLLKTLSHQAAVALEKADLYEQVKSYSEELERKVEKRTAKIKSLQEGQKQMMLEIAHGLQTPLTIIKGELNNLYDQIKDNKKIIALEKTIDRTSKFIYDMLRIANFEASSKKLELDPLSLSELLLELIEGFEIVTQDKNIKIISKIEPGVYIKGDKGSLEELMSNLVSNSVKYMKKEGERKIIIELTKRNKQAVLKIADNGIGIDKKFLPKIFNRFYRVNDKKEEQREGAGLGLAICQRIVLAHQGRISVASKVGQGTEFTIIFPLL